METEILLCDCCSTEHQILFHHFKDDDDGLDEVYVSVHLYNRSFWSRLKYLFGYKSKFGAWDEVIIPRNKFKEMAEKLSSK
jgi:hypothetical protein